ncbi:mandelate racemase/muconate lactonizing enzyme family protein [Paenibacillus piri]|uniref:Mandelate racemase/muconate lactonizing enzyme family protein n=1 Tax=Paenibacillus piri TaxID=2547395 RepID=A0A4R5KCW3_9BACL|nr:mandelate racemase/muconate lactonizing enzyme family protein [Paenibacillus piri]TDF91977.1 mandelate racemase/muconate lactonizing enzyme family protein [Paenibacillus piri]
MAMKIKDVQVYRVQPPGDTWIWVAIRTENGLTGWGEISNSGNDEAAAEIVSHAALSLAGWDPRRLMELTAPVGEWHFPSRLADRIAITAWSGIDQALWDLTAQAFGLPLYHLLGAFGRDDIPLYANLNRGLRSNRAPEALAERGRSALDSGFQTVKCTPFDELTPHRYEADLKPAIARLEALADAVPWSRIAIDCHQRFNRSSLAQFMDYLQDKRVTPYWIEDVFPLADRIGLDLFRAGYPHIRWVAGETALSVTELLKRLRDGGLDVVMPDVKHIGGVSAVKTLIPATEAQGVWVTLHNPSGPISTAFSAHLSVLCRLAVPLEFPWGVSAVRHEATYPAEPVREGRYHLSPERAGIGLRPAEPFLAQYGKLWTSGSWSEHVPI